MILLPGLLPTGVAKEMEQLPEGDTKPNLNHSTINRPKIEVTEVATGVVTNKDTNNKDIPNRDIRNKEGTTMLHHNSRCTYNRNQVVVVVKDAWWDVWQPFVFVVR